MMLRFLPRSLFTAFLLTFLAVPLAHAQIFVDDDAPAGGDGASFATALNSLSDALNQAQSGDQVFVAAGRYTPTTTGDRAETFEITDGVSVFGGFSGTESGSVSPADRPEGFLTINPTLLDGDFDDDSDTATDDLTASFTVVTFTGPGVLDGVIVTGGNDDRRLQTSGTDGVGGGVLIEKAADGSTVINSILRDNDANAIQGASICGFNAGYNLINSLVTETGAGDTLAEIVGAAGHRQDLTGSSGVDAQIRFENVTIAGNGGFVYAKNEQFGTAQLTIDNSVITQNGTTPALAAGTSLIVEADAQVTNTVLEDAFLSECGTLGGCTNVVEVLSPGSGGPGNGAQLTDDGLFSPQGPASPAVDLGDNALLPADATDTDGDGDVSEQLPVDALFGARIENGTVDAGWIEISQEQNIQLNPTALDFGEQPVGTPATQSIEISNTGNLDLTLTSIALSDDGGGVFAIVSGGTAGTLAPGAAQTVEIEFTPSAGGAFTGELTIESNDPDAGSLTAALSGDGAAADIALGGDAADQELDYGAVDVGDTATQTVEVTNESGIADLEITALTIGGANAGDFSITSGQTAPLTIAPGGTEVLDVQYAPSAAGARSATLTIESNDPDEAQVVVDLVGGGAPPLALNAPGGTEVDPGDFFVIEVVAGTDVNASPPIFGVSGEISYDGSLLEVQQLEAGEVVSNNGNLEVITFFADDADAGTLSWSVTRKDGTNTPNFVADGDVIARLEFRVKESANPDPLIATALGLSDISAFDNASNPVGFAVQGIDPFNIVNEIEVFPGDTNNSDIVALDDLFPIGDCFLVTTNTRDGVDPDFEAPADISFRPQQAVPSAFPAAGTPSNGPSPGAEPCTPASTDNPAYVDADGDGEIDEGDVIAIGVHFGKETFGLDGDVLTASKDGMIEAKRLTELALEPKSVGSTYQVDVIIPEDRPLNDLFGAALWLQVSEGVEVRSTAIGDLLANDDLLSIDVSDEAEGDIRRAFTRKRGAEPAQGFGRVFSLELEVVEPMSANARIALRSADLNRVGQGSVEAERGQLTLVRRTDGELTEVPSEFSLQTFPNPLVRSGTVAFSLPEQVNVRIALFDLLGREVDVLFDGDQPAGRHEVSLSASSLAAGSYFVRMEAGSYVETASVKVVR